MAITLLIIKIKISSLAKLLSDCLLLDSLLLDSLFYNIASRATQLNLVTYACSKSRWCTLALMA